MAGVVGTINDPSGVTPIDLSDAQFLLGDTRAHYLDAHGYGMNTIKIIMDAYQSASTVEDFVSGADGCGMTVVEHQWFWEFPWCF